MAPYEVGTHWSWQAQHTRHAGARAACCACCPASLRRLARVEAVRLGWQAIQEDPRLQSSFFTQPIQAKRGGWKPKEVECVRALGAGGS